MKPLVNLDDLNDFREHENGFFKAKFATISDDIGAQKLGYNLSVVPPGKTVCPYHNHLINEEMFLILEGEGTLRFGEKEFPIKKHDIIACPPGGREVAHQIINSGTTDLKYLSLSTRIPHEVCEYPDSDKIMTMVGNYGDIKLRHMTERSSSVDYYHGEVTDKEGEERD